MAEKTNPYTYSPFQPKFEPKVLNHEADYIDVSPNEPNMDIPLLYAPGWGTDSEVLRPIVAAFVKGSEKDPGRRTLAIGAPHGIATKNENGAPMPEARKTAAILEVLRQRGVEKVDAIAHSESGLSLTAAALEHPERFRTIVLVNSGGLIENDVPHKLAVRTVLDTMVDFGSRIRSVLTGGYKPGDASRMANLSRMVVRQQPVVGMNPARSVREIATIGNGNIRERLKELRAKGVRVIIVETSDDGAFPVGWTNIQEEHCDEHIVLPGRHNEIVSDPEFLAEHILEAIHRGTKA
jgi:pimeloyl-ACP methyl ester carboxylesterase